MIILRRRTWMIILPLSSQRLASVLMIVWVFVHECAPMIDTGSREDYKMQEDGLKKIV